MLASNQIREFLYRQRPYLFLALGLFAIGLGISQLHQAMETKVEIVIPTPTPFVLTAEINGAVYYSGVYRFTHPVRIKELLIAAGGLAANADRNWVNHYLNLAAPLNDGEKIYIPRRGEAVAGQQTLAIPLNQATFQLLTTLPGVGPHLAAAIIHYRQNHQGFKTIEELQAVPGIGPQLFQKLKPFLRL